MRRLESLDVFRGATIAAMLLVNNPGSDAVYPPLEHAEWHGWTFTDLIFPFFLWIVGVAMTFSFGKRMKAGGSRGRLLLYALRRAAIIFALGLFLAAIPHFNPATIRIPFRSVFAPLASPVNASLLYAIGFVLLFLGVSYLMYRMKWFIKV